MIRPSLQPDEFDRGHLGRLQRWNAFRDKNETLTALSRWNGEERRYQDGDRTGTPALLSCLTETPLERFIAEHTTLPWRRVISPHKTHIEHGGDDSQSVIAMSGFRLARDHAYLCPQCAAEDEARLGFSYWRRSHQLPGRLVCERHDTPLLALDEQWAFLHSPADYLETARHLVPGREHEIESHSLVRRFHAIGTALTARSCPIETIVARDVLKQRGQESFLQLHGGDALRPLLSDRILASFPRDWLNNVFPAIALKTEGQLFHRLDGVFYFSKSSSTAEAYILAFAVLFDSVDEVLEEIRAREGATVSRRPRRSTPVPDVEALKAAYIQHQGRHSAVAEACKTSVFTASSRLNTLGLPSLAQGRPVRNLRPAAEGFYLDGSSLLHAAERNGVPLSELESLVRGASGPALTHALKAMREDERLHAHPAGKQRSKFVGRTDLEDAPLAA